MNAKELSEYLIGFAITTREYQESHHIKAASLLLSQAAEIEHLNSLIDRTLAAWSRSLEACHG